MSANPQPVQQAARAEFYRRMDRDNLAPLWEVLHALVPPQPQTPCKPALWKYREIRPFPVIFKKQNRGTSLEIGRIARTSAHRSR